MRISMLAGAAVALALVATPAFATKVNLGCKYVTGRNGDVTFADIVITNTGATTIPKGTKVMYATTGAAASLTTTKAEPHGAVFGPMNANAVAASATCTAWWNKP